MMKNCFIFSAGTFYGLQKRPAEGDLIIAADAGLENCRLSGLKPNMILGDFDSMPEPEGQPNCVRFPVEKDDTDTMLSVREGLKQGCDTFYIYGGTGGRRLDHTLANLQTLAFIRKNGAHGYMYDDHFVYTALRNETFEIQKTVEWGLLSLFSMGTKAEHISIHGVQYTVEDATLDCWFPLGVSNHIIDEKAVIKVGQGSLLVGWEIP